MRRFRVLSIPVSHSSGSHSRREKCHFLSLSNISRVETDCGLTPSARLLHVMRALSEVVMIFDSLACRQAPWFRSRAIRRIWPGHISLLFLTRRLCRVLPLLSRFLIAFLTASAFFSANFSAYNRQRDGTGRRASGNFPWLHRCKCISYEQNF